MKTSILIFLFVISHLAYAQCPIGNINLLTQADVDDFVANHPNCERIDGDLIIGSAVRNISSLTSPRIIEGTVSILGANISSISNFDELEFIGGNLEIIETPILSSINGFYNLTSIGNNLIIESNSSALSVIDGFSRLNGLGGGISITNNSGLVTISDFQNLFSVGDWFSIINNDSLKNLPDFEKLFSISGSLRFEENDNLTTIEGFDQLETIGELVGDNDGTDLIISKNNALVSVIGFEKLKIIHRHLFISGNNLTSIPLFNALKTIGGGFEISNSAIQKLSGFNSLTSIGSLNTPSGWFILLENDNLNTVDGFNNLSRIYGDVQIISNNTLESIIGFNQLAVTGGLFQLNLNPALKSLAGLENLTDVGASNDPTDSSLFITDNISLSDCTAICDLLTFNGVNGLIQIVGNPSMCSTEAEIEQDCIPDFDKDGILDDDDLDDDNDGVLDTVEQDGDTDRDTDSDNYPDHQDLDSDNDGCFDVIEAGFTDSDANGSLGNTPDTVDSNGLIIGAADGYTAPLDSDMDGVLDFQQATILSSGISGDLEICVNNAPVDLFNSLGGTPDLGGVWTPNLVSGTGIFNPAIDLAGVYSYTVTNSVCGTNSTELVVTINTIPNAGFGGDLQICTNSAPLSLFDFLTGAPDIGGVWTPSLVGGSGIFDPSIDKAGVYQYTVTNGACGTDTSEVTVMLEVAPNAGTDSNLEVCTNSTSVDLLTSMAGQPDSGGIWTPSLASGTGIFDPILDSDGVYTYTVTNNTCGIDTSKMNVVVRDETPISDYEIKIQEFTSNNSIEIIINSNLNFEFSLDDINYQNSNVFNNLAGGDYRVYAKEVDGCSFLEEMVSILDYPKFFTPNNDGYNDFWKLKGTINENYSIYIYDRYGKLIKSLVSSESSWNGTYNGIRLPTNDYWFKVVFADGNTKYGHFTLKR